MNGAKVLYLAEAALVQLRPERENSPINPISVSVPAAVASTAQKK